MIANPIGSVPAHRRRKDKLVRNLTFITVLIGVLFLFLVLGGAIQRGVGRVSMQFLTSPMSEIFPERSGVKVAMMGSLWIVVLTLLISVPLGVAAAIYLQEISRPSKFRDFVQANIANLAGVPSIVYGLLGLAAFVRGANLGQSILAAALTMSLLVLPTIVLVTQEALRMVPNPIREASLGLGATQWQTLSRQVLPFAFPTILTGVIFSAARAIGETAPLIVIGSAVFIRQEPDNVWSSFTVMPITIYNWASNPKTEFQTNAAAAIVVLLALLVTMNLIAIILRNKYSRAR